MGRHIRKASPGPYRNYSTYKPFLRTEFDYACVYCNVRESEMGGSKNFQIDHYRPASRFPELKCEYSNLYYSCPDCNRSKRAYWPSKIKRSLGRYILNPCDHDVDQFIKKEGINWQGKKRAGWWNILFLRLNSQAKLEIRQARNDKSELAARLRREKAELEEMMANTSNPLELRASADDLSKLQRYLSMLERDLTSRRD